MMMPSLTGNTWPASSVTPFHLTRLHLVAELDDGVDGIQWHLWLREDQVGEHVTEVEEGELAVEEDQGTPHHVRSPSSALPHSASTASMTHDMFLDCLLRIRPISTCSKMRKTPWGLTTTLSHLTLTDLLSDQVKLGQISAVWLLQVQDKRDLVVRNSRTSSFVVGWK